MEANKFEHKKYEFAGEQNCKKTVLSMSMLAETMGLSGARAHLHPPTSIVDVFGLTHRVIAVLYVGLKNLHIYLVRNCHPPTLKMQFDGKYEI